MPLQQSMPQHGAARRLPTQEEREELVLHVKNGSEMQHASHRARLVCETFKETGRETQPK
jgi:hypothetical protein